MAAQDHAKHALKVPPTIITISADAIDEPLLRDSVLHGSCGAISSFVGVTRDNFKGRPVTHLEYEAYESMAIKQLHKICDEARSKAAQRFHHAAHGAAAPEAAVHGIAVAHRTGRVDIGQASVAIFVSSAHRDASLWAVAYISDELKARVPIWKKEFFVGDAGGTWKANAECGCGRRGALNEKHGQHDAS